jgi:hypothetical protein
MGFCEDWWHACRAGFCDRRHRPLPFFLWIF